MSRYVRNVAFSFLSFLVSFLSFLVSFSAPGCVQTGAEGTRQVTSSTETRADQVLVYVGTYTRGESEGIYLFEMDMASGAMV